jgi:hypothetical protein
VTPQSTFAIIAPVPRERVEELRHFLRTMNRTGIPGSADSANELVRFGKFDTLHFARFVILKDETLDDLEPFGPEAAFRLSFGGLSMFFPSALSMRQPGEDQDDSFRALGVS